MKKIMFLLATILLVLHLVESVFAYQYDVKISVVVPAFNEENYVKECLDSIEKQTLEEIEIICIDDGSTDNSGKILDEYAKKDSRFKIIHQENRGLSAARNVGIDLAKGEYIKFVDSDDTIEPTACEECYRRAKLENADIVLHNSVNKTIIGPQYKLLTPVTAWGGAYKTKFLKDNKIKFNEETKAYGEDQAFNLICYPKANKIVCFSKKLYNYNTNNPNSICKTSKVDIHSKNHAKNVKYVYEDWKKNGYFKDDAAKINFLKWFLDMNYWKNDGKINKMFLESIGQELLEDKVLNLLPSYCKTIITKMKNSITLNKN